VAGINGDVKFPMLNTPPAIAIITQKIISLLAQHWQPTPNWWEKCADSFELYRSYLAVACEASRFIVARCSTCEIKFLLDSRARKNQCYCLFGCRKKNRTDKSRKNKKEQRQRDRNKPAASPSQSASCTDKNLLSSKNFNQNLIETINSLKLTDLATSVVQLVSAFHPSSDKLIAKLCGISAFMSAGMKFCSRFPDWFSNVNAKALMEVVDELSSG